MCSLNFHNQQEKFKKAEAEFSGQLLKEIERLAYLVIQSHPWAESFCMAMGSASFGCKWTEFDEHDPSDTWECEENLDPCELMENVNIANSYAGELDGLLGLWDHKFCLTGYPMHIKMVDGKLKTLTDW